VRLWHPDPYAPPPSRIMPILQIGDLFPSRTLDLLEAGSGFGDRDSNTTQQVRKTRIVVQVIKVWLDCEVGQHY
jgi:hypothetical protein